MISVIILVLLTFHSEYVACMDPVTLDLLTPSRQHGEFCGYESCPPSKTGMINVHLVPHTHGELGHGRTFYQHYTGYDDVFDKTNVNMKRILDYTITELWSSYERKFTLGDLPYFFHWWSQRDSTVRRMVYQLLRQGRLHLVGGAWGMPDEATTSYHALIDSFTYTLRKINSTFMECGRPLVAWQSSVFGHSREFTALAALAGFDGLFVSPISLDDEIPRLQRQALEFLWRGNDDLGPESDIYTHKLFDAYWAPPGFCFSTTCKDPLLVTSDSVFRNTAERAKVFIDQILHRQAPGYNTSNVMVMMGVSFGYFDASIWFRNIEKLIAAVNDMSYKMERKMHLFYSTPACYLKAVHEANPRLETKQDDFFPFLYKKQSYMAGMYTSRPSIKLLVREGHVYLQMAKQLQVLAKLWSNDKKFEELMWIMGVMQDQNIISGAMADHVKSYYVEKMYVAIQKSTLILKQAFNKLRNAPTGTIYFRCAFNHSSCDNTKRSSEAFIMIYNSLAWNVTIPVRLPVPNHLYNVYTPNGEKLKVAIMKIPYPVLGIPSRKSLIDHELVFMAEDIPALGYRSYYIERNRSVRKKRSLIKKLKKQNKKYLIRQANSKQDEQSLLKDMDKSDYSFTDAEINPELLILNKKYKDMVNRTKGLLRNKDIDTDNTEYHATTEMIVDSIENDDLRPEVQALPKDPQDYIEVLERKTFDSSKLFKDPPGGIMNTSVLSNDVNDTVEEYDYTDYIEANKSSVPDYKNDTETISKPERTSCKPVTTTENKQKSEDNETEETDTEQNLDETTRAPNEIEGELNQTTTEATRRRLEEKENGSQEEVNKKQETTTESEDDEKEEEMERKKQEELTVSRRLFNYVQSPDLHIENKYIRVNLDPTSKKVTNISLSNGVVMSLDIQVYYFASDDPAAFGRVWEHPPGIYVFRSMDNIPVGVIDYLDVQVYKNRIVEEIHYIYANWASLVVRVYTESPVIEVDWLVGPIPIDDGVGKDVFIRYRTDLVHNGVFYTDSNGRSTIKRIRDRRPLYQPINKDRVAGNYYPVTSKIHIEDLTKNIRFSVMPDRAQGATSLYDGEIDLMVHRRILTDDSGLLAYLNETENGEGIRIRGKHHLYLSKADFKPNRIFEKKFAKELSMPPQVLVSRGWPYGRNSKQIWSQHTNELSFLNNKLPVGVHILTIEQWNDNTILLRLENYLEKSDTVKKGIKTVFIKFLFKNLIINSVRETTLAGNMWLKDFVPLQWKKRQNFLKNFNEYYGDNSGKREYSADYPRETEQVNLEKGIRLVPQQIRTFVCGFEYKMSF